MKNEEIINLLLSDDVTASAAYEMSLSRSDAINRCASLGRQFIQHFHKVYAQRSESFHHHCLEMQGWLDSAREIKLSTTKRFITNKNLYDWFFTACSDSSTFLLESKEVEEYEEFVQQLQSNNSLTIEQALSKYNK